MAATMTTRKRRRRRTTAATRNAGLSSSESVTKTSTKPAAIPKLLSLFVLLGCYSCCSSVGTAWASTVVAPPPPPPPPLTFTVQKQRHHHQNQQRPDTGNVVKSNSNNNHNRLARAVVRRGRETLMRSIPALSVYSVRIDDNFDDLDDYSHLRDRKLIDVAIKKPPTTKIKSLVPFISKPYKALLGGGEKSGNAGDGGGGGSGVGSGVFYGLSPRLLDHQKVPHQKRQRQRQPRLQDSMSEALDELRTLRMEMERMRQEMQSMKRKIIGDDDDDDNLERIEDSEENQLRAIRIRREKQKEAEKLAAQIESWAKTVLQEGEEDGWKPVECNTMVKATLNPHDRTTAYLKWMKDSRGDQADQNDDHIYPCIKCYATIDAPLEAVCTYLAEEAASSDYNDVVEKHRDVEEISPSAKVCWSQSPQILFIKPRDFVTFCHHRWKSDGTEVIVNQAVEHPEFPRDAIEKEGKSCRGYALRGANFLSRCPEDPSGRTQIAIVAHANPGGGLPPWAYKTAINALAPIEPFKLFHKINQQVQRNQTALCEKLKEAEMVSTMPPGRSPRPGGMAQLGYACFWPNGGGLVEGNPHRSLSPSSLSFQQEEDEDNNDDDGQHTTTHNDDGITQITPPAARDLQGSGAQTAGYPV